MVKEKCHFCSKKLGLIYYTCDCNHKFCSQHRYRHAHNCEKDVKSKAKISIMNKNKKIIPKKVAAI